MKLSIIIELEYTEEEGCIPFSEEWSTSDIEKATHRSLKQFLERAGLTVTHMEAASGSLKEAFGVEEYESQKVVLEAQLEASLKVKP